MKLIIAYWNFARHITKTVHIYLFSLSLVLLNCQQNYRLQSAKVIKNRPSPYLSHHLHTEKNTVSISPFFVNHLNNSESLDKVTWEIPANNGGLKISFFLGYRSQVQIFLL